ncbi:MAG: DNA primase [Candidatus Cloacimonadota bacterium]|nr:DNA primase [Candidatus Cloacimonadota bacterium]
MKYDQQVINDVRTANNIVDIIGEYLPLKKAGVNYNCRCPFHNEKTPSFVVSPSKQIFHCFGCGKGGNVFSFLMEYEKINFVESVEKLAKRVGITLPQKEVSKQQQSLYKEMYSIYETANEFFIRNFRDNGKSALEFLSNRNIQSDTLSKFHVGLSPDEWDALVKELKGKGFRANTVMQSGLFSMKNDRIYDKFRSRIIYPIFSVDGKVIGFGGRVYQEGDDVSAKYLNSPENIIYKKRYHLYGLNTTKHIISKKDSAIVVEGYMDLLKLFQFGFENIVASLGTALTTNQIKLLARFTKNINILYDGDKAGYAASLRVIKICLTNDIIPKIIMMPSGFDPDSFLDEYGKAELEKKVGNPLSFYQFIKFYYDADKSLEAKQDAVNELIDDLLLINDPVQRELFIHKTAEVFDIDPDNLLRSMKMRKKRQWKRTASAKVDKNLCFDEKEILKYFINYPQQTFEFIDRHLPEYFVDNSCKKLIKLLIEQENPIEFIKNKSQILDYFNSDERNTISEIIFSDFEYSETNFNKLLKGLKINYLELELDKINMRITEQPNDYDIIREKSNIKQKIKQLKSNFKGGAVRKLLRQLS